MHIRTATQVWLCVGFGCALGLCWSARSRTSAGAVHGAPFDPGAATVGAVAPDFALADTSGRLRRLSDCRGRKVLLGFFCGCAVCAKLAPWYERIRRSSPQVLVLGITSMARLDAARFREQAGSAFPVLLDPDSRVQARYQSLECPRCWVIDQRGYVVYASRRREDVAEIADDIRRHLSPTMLGW